MTNLLNKLSRHSLPDMLWMYIIYGTTFALFLSGLIYGSIQVANMMQIKPFLGLLGAALLVGLSLCIKPMKKAFIAITNFSLSVVEGLASLVALVWILYGIYIIIAAPIALFLQIAPQTGTL